MATIMNERDTREPQHAGLSILAAAAFVATIPLASWMIGNVGDCAPGGPCVVPVGLGLHAPSGVMAIGLALVLRDAVHSLCGWRVAMILIVAGASLSALISPQIAIASGIAFLLAELLDLGVYAPLHKRRLVLAVLLSGLVGSIVDSAVFLALAFGSLDFLAGQVVGKGWASLVAVAVIAAHRRCIGVGPS